MAPSGTGDGGRTLVKTCSFNALALVLQGSCLFDFGQEGDAVG